MSTGTVVGDEGDGAVGRALDVEGPVQAEVFVFWLDATTPCLTGPCGPQAWYVEVGADEDPLDVVSSCVSRVVGDPLLVHSTSWRRHRGAVILTFVVVIEPAQVAGMSSLPVARADLARNSATASAPAVATAQVVEHGLRHLAWLAADDAVVRDRLSSEWKAALGGYVPEPFLQLRLHAPDGLSRPGSTRGQ